MNRSVSCLAVWILGALPAVSAQAQTERAADDPSQPVVDSRAEASSDDSRVSVGAGLGFVGYSSFGGAFYPGQRLAASPSGVGLVELRQSPTLRWQLGLHGTYQKGWEKGGEPDYYPADPGSTKELGLTLGLRHVLNPGGTVEVSPLVSVGGAFSAVRDQYTGATIDSDGGRTALTVDSDGYLVAARLGFVFEYELLPGLHLRFENNLASLGFWRIKRKPSDDESRTDKRISAGIDWSPSLQLRLSL